MPEKTKTKNKNKKKQKNKKKKNKKTSAINNSTKTIIFENLTCDPEDKEKILAKFDRDTLFHEHRG